jgi:hypothetical protein
MQRLLDTPAQRRELAAKGVERSRRFDWDQSTDRLLELFRRVLAQRQGRA